MENIIKIDKIEKYYGNKDNVTKVLNNISFSVNKGEFVGIMGPSGSGKTTLLNCISTIDNVSGGKIILNNTDITRFNSNELETFRRTNLGFIFQDFNLLDTLTVYENIALPLSINNISISIIDQKVNDLATYLNISHILSKYPYQISGGEKQRVAAARAVISSPKLILADEPTGALDSKSARILLETLTKMNRELNSTILMVTHDAFTASYTDRILILKDGKIFTEIIKGIDSRKDFFSKIIEVVTLLGGEDNYV